MTEAFNRSSEKHLRRTLRNDMPNAERLLWSKLRGNQFGVRFRRQYSVGPYVVDYYCAEFKLAIELDGPSHFELGEAKHDADRQRFVESFGIAVLRFRNDELYDFTDAVLERIHETVQKRKTTKATDNIVPDIDRTSTFDPL